MSSPLDKLDDGSNTIQLASAFAVLRKRLWMILAATIAVPAFVGLVVSKQPKEYQASASLVIESAAPQYLGQSFKDVVEMGADWYAQMESLQTELRIIRSHSQALAVIKALCERHLKEDAKPAFERFAADLHCNSPVERERGASLLQALVKVEPIKDSRVVILTATAHQAELAALLVNATAQVYTQRNLERRMQQSEGAAAWLGDEYGDLSGQLNEAERALIEFKRRNQVIEVSIEDHQNDVSSRHKKLADELNNIQVRLIGLRAQREQYAKLKSDDPMLDVSPGVADSPVMIKLKELFVDQYAKLVELRGKYLEKHPAVIAQTARVDAIRADMVRESKIAAKNIQAQYETATKQEHDLKSALHAATDEALQLEQRSIEYKRLKRNFDRLSKLSEQVGGRERETALAQHLKTNNVHILDMATIPEVPVSPNMPKAVGVALLLGFLLGIGLAYLLELLDSTVKTQEDVEKTTGAPFLGLIPSIQPALPETSSELPHSQALANLVRAGSKDLYVLGHPKSAVAECCRAIRTNLLFMSPDRPAKTLLITSAGPQEGKSTTAIHLAITMAQSGLRVLLIDTDMRRPRLHKAFGMAPNQDGVSKAIVGEVDVGTMIREVGMPNLWLLPCGPTPPNPAELLHAERFRSIVAQLEARFDRVLFDSPPIGAVTDGAILARLTSGTILVAKGGVTSKEALGRARRSLTDPAINLLGCVLNDLDLSKSGRDGYSYYYSQYGTYYSDHENETRAVDQAG
jgi:succinoglycan biosynthesis transport protein ExoP